MGYGAVVDAVGGSGGGGVVSSGRWLEVAGETGEDEDEEDEAVFPAVVGEGELFNAVECVSKHSCVQFVWPRRLWAAAPAPDLPVSFERLVNDTYSLLDLRLHALEDLGIDIFSQKCLEFILQIQANLP